MHKEFLMGMQRLHLVLLLPVSMLLPDIPELHPRKFLKQLPNTVRMMSMSNGRLMKKQQWS